MNIVNLIQGTPEWHQFRLAGLGGSDAPVVAGESPYKTPLQLYLEKKQLEVDGAEEDKEFIFAKGHKTEALIRKAFVELTKTSMDPVCMIHPKHAHVRASLDGFDKAKFGVLEAKLVGKAVLEDARDEGIVPRHHWIQMQHCMEVAGVDLAQWFGHNGNDAGILIEVRRDAKFIREQLEKEHAFWELIQKSTPPPMCARDVLVPADLAVLQEVAKAKEYLDNAQDLFDAAKAKLDSYSHPKLRGAGIRANKGSRSGSIDVKKIPGIKSLLDSYTERYLEKFRGPPSKESWAVTIDKKAK